MAEPTQVAAESGTPPQLAILDLFFPGFSSISSLVMRYLGLDLNLYIPMILLLGAMIFAWNYVSEYTWTLIAKHLMSTVEIRVDDEIYNIVMAWVAAQKFAQSSRSFVVNTNLSSRSWFLWKWEDDESDDSEDGEPSIEQQKKTLSYTPSFGSHTFWFRGRLLLFRRSENREQVSFMAVSEREQISISCFGRSPWILKELLIEAKLGYIKKDAKKTLIYRGTCKGVSPEPTWQRSMSRVTRPLSTVILNEAKKKQIVEDLTDYLRPSTRRWYSNRGIPYRRGYLLYGPPGTGKSSLSLALAGHFNMRIYIVSLNSISSSEENLSSLFAELPKRCIVLLEDIDTAGLTNTREEAASADAVATSAEQAPGSPAQPLAANPPANPVTGRLSLSGLLNILDGVASQEGRILIMTTNHLEKLDKALIRPGRVDMTIEFGRADHEIAVSIFTAIFATLEADNFDTPAPEADTPSVEEDEKALALKREEVSRQDALVKSMALDFAAKIPEHEFSPAEIQGYLLTHKRSPTDALAEVEDWVLEMRKQRKEKELKEAEEKRKQKERELKEAEEKRRQKENELKEAEEKHKETRGKLEESEEKRKPKNAFSSDARPGRTGDGLSESGTTKRDASCTRSDSSSDSSAAQPLTPTEVVPVPVVDAGMEKRVETVILG